jgi:hypothetical protein
MPKPKTAKPPIFTEQNTGKCDACGKTELLKRVPGTQRRVCFFGCEVV